MDAASLSEIISAGETYTVEFKGESRHRLHDQSLVEAVVCLANGEGGLLILGVEDDGRVTGAEPRHSGGTDVARVQALIANLTSPPIATSVSLVEIRGVGVLVVDVENARTVVGTRAGLYVRRATKVDGRPECVPFPAHEMLAREIDRGAVDFAAMAARGAVWAALDPLEFERFRSLVRRSGAAADATLAELSDVDIARALGVAIPENSEWVPTLGAILLFGRQEALASYIPTHEAAFQVLTGTDVRVNDFLSRPLFCLAEELMQRVAVRNPEEEIQLGLVRLAVPKVAPVAAREAIANALVHRDYTQLGPVRVQLTDDALEVSSPGAFPPGVRLDNLLDSSRPRSRILADAFKRAGLVERTGRGISRMFESSLRLGRQAPDYSRSNDASVTVVLSAGEADLSLVRLVHEREQALGRPFRLAALQLMYEMREEGWMSTADATTVLQGTAGQARTVLSGMVEDGLVEVRGTGRGSRYHLSASVYRSLDAASGYVRVHSFEPLQQEQMVLSYAAAHGLITRSQAAELCSLTPPQASQLLRRLSDRGLLQLRGQRRGAHYVIPARGQTEPPESAG